MILKGYGDVAGDRLFDEHDDLLDGLEDMRLAYARILGRDAGALLTEPDLRGLVLDLLTANTEDDYESPFVQAMGTECHPDFAHRLAAFRAFRRGVEDRSGDA